MKIKSERAPEEKEGINWIKVLIIATVTYAVNKIDGPIALLRLNFL